MSTDLERRMAGPAAPSASTSIVDLIQRMQPEIARALPAHLSGDRMARIALTELRRNPELARADAASLLGALMWAAQLGLEPGPLGHVYLVPRTPKGSRIPEVVFVVGYRGYAELAYRSGLVSKIHAHVVWQGERFVWEGGMREQLEHTPRLDLMDPKPDQFVASYAVGTPKGGGDPWVAVVKPRDLKRAQAGSAIQSGKGPWSTDFEAMARKTAVRRLASLLPQSAEMAAAIALDEAAAPRVLHSIPSLEEAAALAPPPAPAPDPDPAPEGNAPGDPPEDPQAPAQPRERPRPRPPVTPPASGAERLRAGMREDAMRLAWSTLDEEEAAELEGLLVEHQILPPDTDDVPAGLAKVYPELEPAPEALRVLHETLRG